MSLPVIIIIVVASVLAVILILFFAGKYSSSHKKTISDELNKKIAKIEKEKAKNQAPQEVIEEKSESTINFDAPVKKPEKKVEKNIVFEDYNDKDYLNLPSISNDQKVEQEIKKEESMDNFDFNPEPKSRPSILDILRNREKRKQDDTPPFAPQESTDDGFDEFMEQHSSFSRYRTDRSLIEEIKNLPPDMRAIVLSNLFGRVNHDK